MAEDTDIEQRALQGFRFDCSEDRNLPVHQLFLHIKTDPIRDSDRRGYVSRIVAEFPVWDGRENRPSRRSRIYDHSFLGLCTVTDVCSSYSSIQLPSWCCSYTRIRGGAFVRTLGNTALTTQKTYMPRF